MHGLRLIVSYLAGQLAQRRKKLLLRFGLITIVVVDQVRALVTLCRLMLGDWRGSV